MALRSAIASSIAGAARLGGDQRQIGLADQPVDRRGPVIDAGQRDGGAGRQFLVDQLHRLAKSHRQPFGQPLDPITTARVEGDQAAEAIALEPRDDRVGRGLVADGLGDMAEQQVARLMAQ
jgi:hypothetical protein